MKLQENIIFVSYGMNLLESKGNQIDTLHWTLPECLEKFMEKKNYNVSAS